MRTREMASTGLLQGQMPLLGEAGPRFSWHRSGRQGPRNRRGYLSMCMGMRMCVHGGKGGQMCVQTHAGAQKKQCKGPEGGGGRGDWSAARIPFVQAELVGWFMGWGSAGVDALPVSHQCCQHCTAQWQVPATICIIRMTRACGCTLYHGVTLRMKAHVRPLLQLPAAPWWRQVGTAASSHPGIHSAHVLDQIVHAVAVAKLIVIPRHQLDKGG